MADNEIPARLSFNQFKDWAFLGICTGLVSILVASIYDLDKSVKALSEKLSEKSGEITVIMDEMSDLRSRVTELEKEPADP